MLKQLSAFLFVPRMLLSISIPLDPPSGVKSLAILGAVHLAFLALLSLIVQRAKRSTDRHFMGFSSGVWIAGSAASYYLGLLIPFIA